MNGTSASKVELKLDWATYASAEYACKHWHYSGSISTPPRIMVGVWEEQVFVGVVVFGRGATEQLVSRFGLNKTQGCELTRIALKRHKTHVSRIVAIALRLLRKKNPGLRLVVSFADANKDHHGGIYQAGGWIYTGQTPESIEYITPEGKQVHARTVSKTGIKPYYGKDRKVWRIDQCRKVRMRGKHRYLMPLDDETRQKVQKLAKPYPKRIKHAMAETIGTAAGKHRPMRSITEVA